MSKSKCKKVNDFSDNRSYKNGRLVKFMCGVLNVVAKFPSLDIESRSEI